MSFKCAWMGVLGVVFCGLAATAAEENPPLEGSLIRVKVTHERLGKGWLALDAGGCEFEGDAGVSGVSEIIRVPLRTEAADLGLVRFRFSHFTQCPGLSLPPPPPKLHLDLVRVWKTGERAGSRETWTENFLLGWAEDGAAAAEEAYERVKEALEYWAKGWHVQVDERAANP